MLYLAHRLFVTYADHRALNIYQEHRYFAEA